MKCPYCSCEESDCVLDIVYLHAEGYGGGLRQFPCKSYNQIVKAEVSVRIIVAHAVQTMEESDW